MLQWPPAGFDNLDTGRETRTRKSSIDLCVAYYVLYGAGLMCYYQIIEIEIKN